MNINALATDIIIIKSSIQFNSIKLKYPKNKQITLSYTRQDKYLLSTQTEQEL